MYISKERKKQLRKFQRQHNFRFKNLELLNQAFVHTSYTNENSLDSNLSYEKLEFYGENMNISILFKIAAIGILTAVVNQVLKYAGKDEIATLTTLAGLVIVLLTVVNLISNLFTTIKDLFALF